MGGLPCLPLPFTGRIEDHYNQEKGLRSSPSPLDGGNKAQCRLLPASPLAWSPPLLETTLPFRDSTPTAPQHTHTVVYPRAQRHGERPGSSQRPSERGEAQEIPTQTVPPKMRITHKANGARQTPATAPSELRPPSLHGQLLPTPTLCLPAPSRGLFGTRPSGGCSWGLCPATLCLITSRESRRNQSAQGQEVTSRPRQEAQKGTVACWPSQTGPDFADHQPGGLAVHPQEAPS